jgi:hypothetical protein
LKAGCFIASVISTRFQKSTMIPGRNASEIQNFEASVRRGAGHTAIAAIRIQDSTLDPNHNVEA